MSTEKQIAANQINSEKSTGPQSETGKIISSLNACKHGLYGAFRVLSGEDQSEYEVLLFGLVVEFRPETNTESLLVESMAQHHWLRQRALHLQNNCFESDEEPDMRRLSLYMRYETMHERAYHKCLTQLLKLRAEKQKQEIGFVSKMRRQEKQVFDFLRRQAHEDERQNATSYPEIDAEELGERLATAITRENEEKNLLKAA